MSTYASGCRPSLLSSLSQSCAHPDTHSIACLRRHCNGQALYAAAASSLQGRSCRLQTVTMLPCCHSLGDGSRGRTLQSCIASPAGKEGGGIAIHRQPEGKHGTATCLFINACSAAGGPRCACMCSPAEREQSEVLDQPHIYCAIIRPCMCHKRVRRECPPSGWMLL